MRARRLAPALLLLLLATSAHADFKDTYRKGFEAVERKRWADVVTLMRQAIAENPTEGAAVKLYGMRFETYLPHFHLGVALVQLGDCKEAAKELGLSEAQGAVRSSPYYGQLLTTKAVCDRVAGNTAPPPTTPAPVTTTTTTLPPTTTTLAPATTTRPTPPPPTTRPTTLPTPPPTTTAAPVSAPADLVRAAEAYFGGRYREAADLLDRLPSLTGRVAAQAHLFRAATHFALYRLDGEKNDQLRARAVQDIASCRSADPALVPDPEAFPPPFAELFRASR